MHLLNNNKLKEWGIVDFSICNSSIPHTYQFYTNWVSDKKHLPLTYLEGDRHLKRSDLLNYWPQFNEAIVFLFSYYPAHQKLSNFYKSNKKWNGLKLASYTLGFNGDDYHHHIKEIMTQIGDDLKSNIPNLEFKIAMDIHPVLDRDLAYKSGLGWFGKNSMLINRHHGSFNIIGSLLVNVEISSYINKKNNYLETDHCGQCTKCIDACPTNAIDINTRTIIAKDCISTFTIEQFKLDSPPSDKMNLKDGFIFGCDICQDVCPWNLRIDRKNIQSNLEFKNEKEHELINFFLMNDFKNIINQLQQMSGGMFKKIFMNTSFYRSGKKGILKNFLFYLNNYKK